ncbi:MAG TPA: glycosyltransferase family 87 protein [Candidatus Dormibacteraeota bacterium]|nr:glycosyltransferase family 87 protein [Candidatus Dormibacteraeota bacterium]
MFIDVNIRALLRRRLLLAFAVVLVALCVDILHRNDTIAVDFHTYVAAGQVGIQHGWSHIYDQALVAVNQKQLAPEQVAQPFLSPPTIAYVIAPIAFLPYAIAYVTWAVLLLVVFAAALAWSGVSTGWSRWIAIVGALSPWWVMEAVNVGQIVPIQAAACVVAWRLLRDKREVLAGIALAAILFKPNNSLLVPFALLFALRVRLFATWVAISLAVLLIVVMTIGVGGMSDYVVQLTGPLPKGSDNLTLRGALAASGTFAAALRIVFIASVLAAGHRLRSSPALVIPIALVGSLLVSPYLHPADLCMLSAAGFIAWEELKTPAWRVPLAAVWVVASPYLYVPRWTLHSRQWPWLEMALLGVLLLAAWWPSLTAGVTSRRRSLA